MQELAVTAIQRTSSKTELQKIENSNISVKTAIKDLLNFILIKPMKLISIQK